MSHKIENVRQKENLKALTSFLRKKSLKPQGISMFFIAVKK
jgi:hypothetical protein